MIHLFILNKTSNSNHTRQMDNELLYGIKESLRKYHFFSKLPKVTMTISSSSISLSMPNTKEHIVWNNKLNSINGFQMNEGSLRSKLETKLIDTFKGLRHWISSKSTSRLFYYFNIHKIQNNLKFNQQSSFKIFEYWQW